ncbi:MAG: hypothetical protein HY815_08835 [Candidatus Riflebacteria bacterium]|nr:hypothetical protein [Candidatus Riflebacteria bacterium]
MISNLPLGRYRIGYSADGFLPIAAGSSSSVDVYVESGRYSQAPSVIMEPTSYGTGSGGGSGGPANLLVTLLDSATGEPIPDAVVTAGVASATGYTNGVYSLMVPVPSSGSVPTNVGLGAQAAGYDPQSLTPREVGIVPNQIVSVTARMGPFPAGISGQIRVAGAYQSLLSTVEVRVNGISPSYTRANVTASGAFRLTVPASTYGRTRVYTLTFISPYFNLAVVSGVVAPLGGEITLPGEVVLTPIGVDLLGSVYTSTGLVPSQGTVTISELGKQAVIVNGTYSFTGVPTGVRLTLQAVVVNSFGFVETGSVSIVPTINGGPFMAPTIITR